MTGSDWERKRRVDSRRPSSLTRWPSSVPYSHDEDHDEDMVDRVLLELSRRKSLLLSLVGVMAVAVLAYAAFTGTVGERIAPGANGVTGGASEADGPLPRLPGTGDEATLSQASPDLALVAESVVQLVGLDADGAAVCTGSGVIVESSGVILTNAHVVAPSSACPLETVGVAVTESVTRPPNLLYAAEVLQVDDNLDLALVRIARRISGEGDALPSFPAATIGDSDTVALGDSLRIIGYPVIGGDTITSASGEVSGFGADEQIGEGALIKTDAVISAGNSGGMAISADGALIGIPTKARASESGPGVDCRPVLDTNRDGLVDEADGCVSVGGFINGIRPVNLAAPLLAAHLGADAAGSTIASADEAASPTAAADVAAAAALVDSVRVYNPRFSSGQVLDSPVDELHWAAPGVEQLCLFVDWQGIPNGTHWDGVWYLDGNPISDFSTIGASWSFGSEGGNFWMCAIDEARGFAPGLYEVALWLEGHLVFAEAITVGQPQTVHAVTWVNQTGGDLCQLAVNPLTPRRQVGANEMTVGQVLADGESLTMLVAEGVIIAEAFDCDGEVVADILTGEEIDGPVTFTISG